MPRPQFTLRALLVGIAATCAGFGSWKLVVKNNEGLSAGYATAGRPFALRSRFVRLLPPRPASCSFFVVLHHDVNVSSTVVWPETASVTRTWLVFYTAEIEMTLARSGTYDASASLAGESEAPMKCKFQVEDGI